MVIFFGFDVRCGVPIVDEAFLAFNSMDEKAFDSCWWFIIAKKFCEMRLSIKKGKVGCQVSFGLLGEVDS